MKLCHAASSSSYLLCLSFQQPMRFPIKMLLFFFHCILHHSWAYVVAGVMRRYSGANMNDMQLRVGSVGQISRGLGGQGASSEPSVARRILVGKMLICRLLSPPSS